MEPETEEGPLPRLDARRRKVGAWLLVGYTVALVRMTFAGERLLPPPASGVAGVEVVADD
jgi:hypothetical protein